MKRFLLFTLCFCIMMSISVTTSFASEEISEFEIYIKEPVPGEKASYEAVVPSDAQYAVTNVKWIGVFGDGKAFRSDYDYTVQFTVEIKDNVDGYIKKVAGNAKINGQEADIYGVTEDKKQVTISKLFRLTPFEERPFENAVPASDEDIAEEEGYIYEEGDEENSEEIKFMPDNISLNDFEWEVLRLINIERAKEGLQSLCVNEVLQSCADVREKEIQSHFSHTRPDGTKCFSAIPADYKWTSAAENIAMGQTTPLQVVKDWMESDGHRANILNDSLDYVGIGYYQDGWVTLFTSGENIIKVNSSSDLAEYTKEDIHKVFLTCKDSEGIESYMPLDFDSMILKGDKYLPRLSANKLPEFSLKVEKKETAEQIGVNFEDVAPKAYYADAVMWAVNNNITVGTSATTFSPENTCTRAEILTFLWRAVGAPKSESKNPFIDVKSTDYYYDAALWAVGKGMVTGKEFKGNIPCTRASTVIYLWQYAGSPFAQYGNNFEDVSINDSYSRAVAWALKENVTAGTSAVTFSPDMICTRGQIVTFLHRALK